MKACWGAWPLHLTRTWLVHGLKSILNKIKIKLQVYGVWRQITRKCYWIQCPSSVPGCVCVQGPSSVVHWLWPHDSKLILPGLTKAEAEKEAAESPWTHENENETSIQFSQVVTYEWIKMESFIYIYPSSPSWMFFLTNDAEFNEAINYGWQNDIG